MADFLWPTSAAFVPRRFKMRVAENSRTFASPYSQQIQVIDLLSDWWEVEFDMTPNEADPIAGGQIEAYFDRLKGAANRMLLWNFQRPLPMGTMRGSPVLTNAVPVFANTLPITTLAGKTLLRGDMIGAGTQLFRVLADATADSGGHMTVEVAPRVRIALSAGDAVVWNAPTAPFVLTSRGAGVDWTPDSYAAPAITAREDF